MRPFAFPGTAERPPAPQEATFCLQSALHRPAALAGWTTVWGDTTMRHRFQVLSLLALAGLSAAAQADTLLIERVDKPAAEAPARGLSMAEVEARFGAPQEKLDPRGGQKKQWPTINRWVYPEYVVYFEKNRVIDVVAHKASPNEIGPKPAIR